MSSLIMVIGRCLLEKPLMVSELVDCVGKFVSGQRKDVLRVYVHRYVNRLAKHGYLRVVELSGKKRKRKLVDITPGFVVLLRLCDCNIGAKELVDAVVRRAPELERFGTVCLKVAEKLGLLQGITDEEKKLFCEEMHPYETNEPAGEYSWKDAVLYATYIGLYIDMLQYGHVAGLKLLGEEIAEAIEEVWKELGKEYRNDVAELASMVEDMLTYVKSRLEEEKAEIEAKLEYVNNLIKRLSRLTDRQTGRWYASHHR